jgi:adenylate cyclase
MVFQDTTVGYTVISFSKEFISERVRGAAASVVVVAVIAIILVSLLSIPLASRLLRPLFRLFKGTKEIAIGNFDYRIPEGGKDEMGELIRSFNMMAMELKKKEVMKGVFNRYVSPDVADEILKEPESIRLGGERRDVTVFFADIRDFTSHSVRMPPEEIVEILNRYFTLITEIVFRFEGTIDKFIGDAVMGVFGSPIKSEAHLGHGIKAVFAIREAVSRVNQLRETMGQVPFHVGIGLDSGEVIVGNMGSSMRMEYTAVGEAVNMASRLSSMARGGEILINGELYASLQGMVVAEALTDTVIKGIDRPVKLYNIVELKGGWKSEVEDFVEEETERLVTDGMVP